MSYLQYKKFKIVNRNKKKVIKNLFNDVSARYNLMNDIMSFGFHRIWKRDMIEYIKKEEPKVILDLAGGTGDISLLMSKIYKNIDIIIYDLSINMMLEAKNKISKSSNRVNFINGSAEELAISDNSIDLLTIGFGIRNFSNIKKAVDECYRVLKFGKKLYCLEFSPSCNTNLLPLYDAYSSKIIPKIGKYIARNQDAYKYLVESIRKFQNNVDLKNIFKESGFFCYTDKKYLGGIAYLNIFYKI